MSVCLSIWKLTTGMTWVTPSPLSMTVPVSVLSPTCLDVQEAARASTAWNTGDGLKTDFWVKILGKLDYISDVRNICRYQVYFLIIHKIHDQDLSPAQRCTVQVRWRTRTWSRPCTLGFLVCSEEALSANREINNSVISLSQNRLKRESVVSTFCIYSS